MADFDGTIFSKRLIKNPVNLLNLLNRVQIICSNKRADRSSPVPTVKNLVSAENPEIVIHWLFRTIRYDFSVSVATFLINFPGVFADNLKRQNLPADFVPSPANCFYNANRKTIVTEGNARFRAESAAETQLHFLGN